MKVRHTHAAMAVLALGLALGIAACKPEAEKLAANKGLSDEKALEGIAEQVWHLYSGGRRRIALTKAADGKFSMSVRIEGGSITAAKNAEMYREIELLTAAQDLWRVMKFGSRRNLDAVTLTLAQQITGGRTIEVCRVRLTLDQLKKVSEWQSADPYDVDEHDLLDESVRHIPKEIRKVWTMEMDNFAAIRI